MRSILGRSRVIQARGIDGSLRRRGSPTCDQALRAGVVGMATSADGNGYWIADQSGRIAIYPLFGEGLLPIDERDDDKAGIKNIEEQP